MVADYLKLKIQQGWERIADQHPGIDFGVSTPEVNEAQARLDAEYIRWAEGKNQVADVLKAFRCWEAELVAANQTTAQMFG